MIKIFGNCSPSSLGLSPEELCAQQGGKWENGTCVDDLGIKDSMKQKCAESGGTWTGTGCVKSSLPDKDKVEKAQKTIEGCQKDLGSAPECEKLRALCNDPAALSDPSSAEICKGLLAPPPKGMGTGTKIALAAGALAILGVGFVALSRRKNPESERPSFPVERKVGFCGVDGNRACLSIDGARYTFEAVEDEVDGYRSMLDEVKSLGPTVPSHGVFFKQPIAQVRAAYFPYDPEDPGFEGYHLIDDSGHVWLRMGTDHTTDYYPMFTFDYDPPRKS